MKEDSYKERTERRWKGQKEGLPKNGWSRFKGFFELELSRE